MLGDPHDMKIKPYETANDHLLKKERQYYRKGVDDHMSSIDDRMSTANLAWADDRLPVHVQFDNDQPEEDSKHCFSSCNTLENPVLRNLNGIGRQTMVSDRDMQETTEQFAWDRPRTLKYDDKQTLADMVTPVPKQSKKPRRSRGRKN